MLWPCIATLVLIAVYMVVLFVAVRYEVRKIQRMAAFRERRFTLSQKRGDAR